MNLAGEQSALTIATAICVNVDAYWENRRSYEDFHAEQGKLWDAAERAGIVDQVSALLPVNQRN